MNKKYICNVDGKAIFATHFIECELVDDNNIPFQFEDNGIVCYSKNESVNAIKLLKESNIPYVVHTLVDGSQSIPVDSKIKFKNKSEIVEYLNSGIIPETKREEDLKRKVEVLEQQVKVLMDKLSVKY